MGKVGETAHVGTADSIWIVDPKDTVGKTTPAYSLASPEQGILQLSAYIAIKRERESPATGPMNP